MEQIGFFEEPEVAPPPRSRGGVRRNDPESSHIAADMVDSFGGTHREIVLAALRKFGPMTDDRRPDRRPHAADVAADQQAYCGAFARRSYLREKK